MPKQCCDECRRHKLNCFPLERLWPQTKCDRCNERGLACSPPFSWWEQQHQQDVHKKISDRTVVFQAQNETPSPNSSTVSVGQYVDAPYQNTWGVGGSEGRTSSLATIHGTPAGMPRIKYVAMDSMHIPYCYPLITREPALEGLGIPQLLHPHCNPLERLWTRKKMPSGTSSATGHGVKLSQCPKNSKEGHEGGKTIDNLAARDAEVDDVPFQELWSVAGEEFDLGFSQQK